MCENLKVTLGILINFFCIHWCKSSILLIWLPLTTEPRKNKHKKSVEKYFSLCLPHKEFLVVLLVEYKIKQISHNHFLEKRPEGMNKNQQPLLFTLS